MTEPMSLMASSATYSDQQYRYPVHTPTYQYLVCDLLTDQLQTTLPLVGVKFDRRLSRTGQLKGQWRISTQAQALAADEITKLGGKLALWVLRNKRLWWGGILWSAKGSATEKSYDTIDIQAATFDSYPDRRYLDWDWGVDNSLDLTEHVLDIWLQLQDTGAASDIGVAINNTIANYAGAWPDKEFKQSELKTYGEMIRAYTDGNPGLDYTIDVYKDAAGNRVKSVRVAGSFREVLVENRLSISGYKIPTWRFSRDSVGMGTAFQAWGDPQESNVGEAQEPVSGLTAYADDLLAAGWPRLDVVENVGAIPKNVSEWSPLLNNYAEAMRDRMSGIRDVVSYDVDLSTSEWHPNLIGQNVVIRHSKRDLWRAGQTSVVTPVVAEFTAPDRGQPEQVAFTIDGGEEDA